MTWFAEFRHAEDQTGQWLRLGESRNTRERAKADARKHKEAHPHLCMKARYRIVMDDQRQIIDEVSEPPHGWRMRWRWTPLPNNSLTVGGTPYRAGACSALDSEGKA